jgi:hypothetical protein
LCRDIGVGSLSNPVKTGKKLEAIQDGGRSAQQATTEGENAYIGSRMLRGIGIWLG